MSRFLFTVWPLAGHIHPNLAIAAELRKLGHTPAFFTGSKARAAVENAGFQLFPFDKLDEGILDRLVLGAEGILSSTGRPFRLRNQWRDWVLGTVPQQIEDLNTILDAWQPDAIVCDPTMWAPFLVLHEKRRVPVAVFSLVPACHLSGAGGPVLGFALPKPRNRLERARTELLRKLSYLFLTPVRRQANGMRERHGLPALRCSVTDHAGRMPLYLVPGSPEFDYHRRGLPESVHYVGCCSWTPAASEGLPGWIDNLPPEQPLVYASEGTIQLDPRLLRTVAQGLANLPIQVILTTGRHRTPASMDLGPRPLAPNIHAVQWVPLTPLLPRLSAVVTIGGPSTLMPCLERGVPVVIVPFNWDHPETAWRISESGCGIRLTPRECVPSRMREAVMRVLSEPGYRAGARRIAESLERCGGAPRAAQLLAAMAREGAAFA
ncbi:MAG: glycosyltransferase [Bryobacteraceae bacterium]